MNQQLSKRIETMEKRVEQTLLRTDRQPVGEIIVEDGQDVDAVIAQWESKHPVTRRCDRNAVRLIVRVICNTPNRKPRSQHL
ncbi:MAG: hypothetical protein ACRERV_04420 [Methylococcales bacterium]